jgi:hypothetical protein
MSIKTGNLRAVAYHLEQGHDNGDITRDALALFLRGVADEIERNERLQRLLDDIVLSAIDMGTHYAVGTQFIEAAQAMEAEPTK